MADVKTKETMLSTKDNPYNPFTHWDAWLAWDMMAGYHTNAYLARVVRTSDELSDGDQAQSIIDGMEEIVRLSPLKIYIIVDEDYVPGSQSDE